MSHEDRELSGTENAPLEEHAEDSRFCGQNIRDKKIGTLIAFLSLLFIIFTIGNFLRVYVYYSALDINVTHFADVMTVAAIGVRGSLLLLLKMLPVLLLAGALYSWRGPLVQRVVEQGKKILGRYVLALLIIFGVALWFGIPGPPVLKIAYFPILIAYFLTRSFHHFVDIFKSQSVSFMFFLVFAVFIVFNVIEARSRAQEVLDGRSIWVDAAYVKDDVNAMPYRNLKYVGAVNQVYFLISPDNKVSYVFDRRALPILPQPGPDADCDEDGSWGK